MISKTAFMRYFDDELAARIQMRDIASVQERILRKDVEEDYEFEEVFIRAMMLHSDQ